MVNIFLISFWSFLESYFSYLFQCSIYLFCRKIFWIFLQRKFLIVGVNKKYILGPAPPDHTSHGPWWCWGSWCLRVADAKQMKVNKTCPSLFASSRHYVSPAQPRRVTLVFKQSYHIQTQVPLTFPGRVLMVLTDIQFRLMTALEIFRISFKLLVCTYTQSY